MKKHNAVMRALSLSIFLVIIGLVQSATAANYYCGPTSAGAANGSDWNNCYNFNTLTLARGASGNTYYLMEGNYAGKTFGTAASGTSVITIKKCGAGDGVCERATGYVAL